MAHRFRPPSRRPIASFASVGGSDSISSEPALGPTAACCCTVAGAFPVRCLIFIWEGNPAVEAVRLSRFSADELDTCAALATCAADVRFVLSGATALAAFAMGLADTADEKTDPRLVAALDEEDKSSGSDNDFCKDMDDAAAVDEEGVGDKLSGLDDVSDKGVVARLDEDAVN